MFVSEVALSNFRNYEKLNIKLSSGTNILYGDNAQGKTNLLEAIYMTATTKSHRGAKDRDIIRIGCDDAHIRLILSKRDVSERVDMHLRKSKAKGVAINGIPIRRSTELLGLMHVIAFSPEDLYVIKRGPGERRRFMDIEISQLDRVYNSNLQEYNKILEQRNNLLKQLYGGNEKSLLDTLDVWDSILSKSGKEIIAQRRRFIDKLNTIIEDMHGRLTDGKEAIKLLYEPNVSEEEIENSLRLKRNLDRRMKMTMTGPQRDDMGIFINGTDARIYGSQGQQRTAALSLKLSEIELVKDIINDNPILLLDDVMSELDEKRRDALLRSIADIQTVITCTGYDSFIKERVKSDSVYRVERGRITEE